MKNFKLIPVLFTLSLALLFSVNSPVLAYVNAGCNNYCACACACDCDSDCCECCGYCGEISEYYYSPDRHFRVSKSASDYGLIIVERHESAERCVSYRGCLGAMERVEWFKEIFAFKNLVSFSFSKDSKYLLVERSEYSTKFNVQNDFIEIFDLVNENRIFYIPFIKKCYPSKSLYTKKSCPVGILKLNFYEDTLASVSLDNIILSTYLSGVKSVYMSQVSLVGLSIKFNDGCVNFYLPEKDFSGLNLVACFNKNILASEMRSFHVPHACY